MKTVRRAHAHLFRLGLQCLGSVPQCCEKVGILAIERTARPFLQTRLQVTAAMTANEQSPTRERAANFETVPSIGVAVAGNVSCEAW